MNDKIIINTISKIHFMLVSALSFILLTLFLIFILLQNGIYLDNVSFQNVQATKLYIKWNNKLSVVVKELNITDKKSNDIYKIDEKEITKTIKKILLFDSWFEKIVVEKMVFNKVHGSLDYIYGEKGSLHLSSPDFTFKSSLFFQPHLLNIHIDELSDTKRDIKISGDLILSSNDKIEATSSLDVNINGDTKFKIYANSDSKKLFYKIESMQNIKNSKQIIDMFDIDAGVKYWIYDAIEMSSLSINSAYGWLAYDDINNAFKNIHVKAVANDLKYTYDTQLKSVDTKYTDLEFKDGILYIKPQEAYSYNFFLDKSWLKIDFSTKEEILTLHLLFNAKVNEELKGLLERYEIKLPFLQTKGVVKSKLKLEINLRTIDVTAVGDFYAKEAQINYLDLDIDLFDTHVLLNNQNVKTTKMVAKYKDIASSQVNINFNAKESTGNLDFLIDKISLKEKNLNLITASKPLKATYKISPLKDYITIGKSTWKLKENIIKVDSMKVPFDMKGLTAKVPTTAVEISDLASAFVSGKIELKPKRIDLLVDLLSLSYGDIKLDQSMASLNFLYDEKFTLSTKKPVIFDILNREYLLDNIEVEIESDMLIVKNIFLEVENILKSNISGKYSINDSNGSIDIHNIEFANTKTGELFKNEENIKLNIYTDNNSTNICSNEYDLNFILNKDEWKLNLASIEKISQDSKILKKYNFTNGSFTIYKKSSDKNIKFMANTDSKYKIIATDNKLVENYFINGEIDNKSKEISLKINDSVDVKIKESVQIKADNIGINIDEILNFFSDVNSSDEGNISSINLSIDAKNCYLYVSENRHVISEKIELQYFNKILTAQLMHKEGYAGFKLSDKKFHLYGEKFNDEFMQKLFALSKFKGGTLDFSMSGTTKEYSGIIYAKNTTVLQYKILNNILAFVNTIPSLVTFSLPGYNNNGLAVENAYINFQFKDDLYNMSDISLESKEINIVGTGEASLKKNSINLDLNLKTDLGSSISKIPLVGYILLGKENISTSLKVTGALDNPDINTQVAKDIIVSPLNIIKRTLMYPLELLKSKKDE